ncbi:MAG: hypothetical protein R3B54_11805 [Bdellovibrionota bacterium]
MRRFAFILLFCVTPAWGVETYYVGYRVVAGDEVYDAYVVKPLAIGRVLQRIRGSSPLVDNLLREGNRKESAQLLNAAADFVENESTYLEHINQNTRSDYNRELFLLRNGYWPAVMVTEAGKPEKVLLTLAIAIQWEPAWLPVQDRFFDRGLQGLPRDLPDQEYRLSDENTFQYPVYFLEGGQVHQSKELSGVLSELPWVEGGEAEVKFFMRSKELKKNLARVAQALVLSHELHRWSATPVPRLLAESQKACFADPAYRDSIRRYFADIPKRRGEPPEAGRAPIERLLRGIETVLVSGDIQHTVMNSKLLVQSSGPALGGKRGNLTSQLYRSRFGFPAEATWSFMENERVGTPGIHTDIFEMSLNHYEEVVTMALLRDLANQLSFVPLLFQSEVQHLPSAANHMPFANCAHLFSYWYGGAVMEAATEASRLPAE